MIFCKGSFEFLGGYVGERVVYGNFAVLSRSGIEKLFSEGGLEF